MEYMEYEKIMYRTVYYLGISFVELFKECIFDLCADIS